MNEKNTSLISMYENQETKIETGNQFSKPIKPTKRLTQGCCIPSRYQIRVNETKRKYNLWGHIKFHTFCTKPQYLEELRDNIQIDTIAKSVISNNFYQKISL